MANLAGVLKELKLERSRLEQAIEVIGKLVGRNGTAGRTVGARPKRTLSMAELFLSSLPVPLITPTQLSPMGFAESFI